MGIALDWVLDQPWAILPSWLDTICQVAARENEDVEAVAARLGRPLQNAHKAEVHGDVAVVPVRGPIARYSNLFTEVSGATSVECLARDIRTALDDPAVRGVVLDIDSPGGQVAGVADLAQQIRLGKHEKPIVAFAADNCCSGAYWLAAACTRVVASKTAEVGSIGVVIQPRSRRSRPEDPPPTVSSGAPLKRTDPRSETGQARLQALANDMEEAFVGDIAADRGVTPQKVRADFGRGGTFIGARAVAAGMVDEIGTLDSVIGSLSLSGARYTPTAPATLGDVGAAAARDAIQSSVGGATAPASTEEPEAFAMSDHVETRTESATQAAATDPRFSDLHREIEDLKKARRADALASIRREATAWLREPAVAARVTPNELAILAGLYEALASVDLDAQGDGPRVMVQGADGKAAPETLARGLVAAVKARPPHRLYQEMIPADAAVLYPGATLLAADGEGQDPTAAADEEWAAEKARRRNGPAARTH